MNLAHAALLLALCAGPAAADTNTSTIISCREGSTDLSSWTMNGSDVNACHQTSLGAGMEPLDGEPLDKLAAFKGQALVGLRDHLTRESNPHNTRTYQPHEWADIGSIGPRGELWWGRVGNRHVAVGQQSSVRLRKELRLSATTLGPQISDFMLRRMMAAMHKTQMTRKPGDERFTVFNRKRINYIQHAATTATFTGGSGGDGQIPPGAVSNARLELDSDPAIVGQLSFDVMVDGVRRAISFPLASKHAELPLRAIPIGTRDYVLCEKRPNRPKAGSMRCELDPQAYFKERYDATGVFYGDHARLVAVHVTLEMISKSRNRHDAWTTLLIILKARE